MIYTIQGTHEDSVGQLIAGYFSKAVDNKVIPPYSAIGWIKNDKIVGQAVFVDFTESNMDIHLNATGCMCKKTIRDVYRYVFIQSKCNRLTAKPKTTNEKLLQLLPRLGFEYEYTSRDYYGPADNPSDAAIYKLTKNNALRWLREIS